jgi:hypothetical protein
MGIIWFVLFAVQEKAINVDLRVAGFQSTERHG